MSTFRKYDHLERLGHDEVAGIELGGVHVFPKLDGTNGAVFCRDGTIVACSRNRELSLTDDNQGFAAWVHGEDSKAETIRVICTANPELTVYGEFLIPHTLRTYREDAWRRFWVFDVYDAEEHRYMTHAEVVELFRTRPVDIIEPMCVITNPSAEQLQTLVATNTYLIADGAGLGEGIVIKNYSWKNQYGRQPWAKIVMNEFKEKSRRAFGTTEKQGEFQVELVIAEEYVTPALVGKTRAKIVTDLANEKGIDLGADPTLIKSIEVTNRGKIIPQLLGRVFHDLVIEDCWMFLKKHKMPIVNFKKLEQCVIARVKSLASDLF